MTSTSFINWTGLKKWTPTKLLGRPDASAIWVMESEDVLDAKIVSGLHCAPRSAYSSFFRSRFSIMASTIRSESVSASRSVVNVIFDMRASASEEVSRSLATSLSTEF